MSNESKPTAREFALITLVKRLFKCKHQLALKMLPNGNCQVACKKCGQVPNGFFITPENPIVAKEFWIGEDYIKSQYVVPRKEYDGPEWTGHIRVIEYSEYERVKTLRDKYRKQLEDNEWRVESDMRLEYDNLKLQCEALAEALKFYSHEVRYHTHYNMGYGLNKSEARLSCMDVDSGNVAREALAKYNGERGGV